MSSRERRPAGSTASTSRRRWHTTGRRTRSATSGSSVATSRCCCAGRAGYRRFLKVPLLLAGARRKPVLKGDAIAQWMYGALRDMDRAGSQPAELETLMPPSHALELFVTVTDFHGYRRDVAIADPKLIGERAHRHVLAFRLGRGVDQFDEAHNGALAFSARTTMSFPGCVPAGQPGVVPGGGGERRPATSRPVLPELFRSYELAHADPRATFFIDGGVLDNKPFGHAIGAIKRRAADSEVERRLLYLEPDPGGGGGAAPGGDSPSPIATVLASISGLPRQEPVLDDILEVNRHNERVLRIREIVETSFDPIRRADRGDRRYRARPADARAVAGRRRAVAHRDQRGREGRRRLRLPDLRPQQGERRRRQLRTDDLPPLRLPRRLQPGGIRARGRPRLGRHASATRRGRPAGSGRRPGRVPVHVRPRLPCAPAALRDRRPQRVVRARRGARLPDARASSTRASACSGRRGSCSSPRWTAGSC